MSLNFLIDGYNLLHFAGLARAHYGPGDLQRARDRLLKRLQRGLAEDERARTTIVFDAQSADCVERCESRLYGMRVLFSPPGREADDTIEELIAAHSAPKQLVVVSSDNRLRRAARAGRAGWLDSDSFLVELDRREQVIAKSKQDDVTRDTAGTPQLTKQELESWLAEFGDVKLEALRSEVRSDQKRDKPRSLGSEVETPSEPLPDKVPVDSGTDQLDVQSTDATPSELSFWERRVAELFQEQQPGSEPPADRQP